MSVRVVLHSKSSIVADIPAFERELDSGNAYADADLTAEGAGRLCYLSWSRPNPSTKTNPDYLLNIAAQRHYSVLGHAAATFYIDGISRNCSHEIIRSRWFTFSEVSQRFVDGSNFNFVGHPGFIEENDEDLNRVWDVVQQSYHSIVKDLEAAGLRRKQVRQTARQVLPGGVETSILMSGNLRAWRDFLAQRLSEGADDEIRAVALEIYAVLKKEFPGHFQDFDSQGMITTERLIQRALDRYDSFEYKTNDFVAEIRDILNRGVWTLRDDPWEEKP